MDAWEKPVNVTSIWQQQQTKDEATCSIENARRPAQVVTSAKMRVSTLALEHHHWFFVHGVRVHNKGGGGRGVKVVEGLAARQGRVQARHTLHQESMWCIRCGYILEIVVAMAHT